MSQFGYALTENSGSRRTGRIFSLAEALRALPLVRRVAADVQMTQASRLRLQGQLTEAGVPMGRRQRLHEEFTEATSRLERLIEELEMIGVELKDAARAILDFPAEMKGRRVLLCWKPGETTITHWHEVGSGYTGRKPLAGME